MGGNEQTSRVAAVAGEALAGLGLRVDDVALTPAGKRRLLRISVDRDLSDLAGDDHTSVVPPLTLDEVAEATRAINEALDRDEPLGQAPYVLEVTSPGVSRSLTEPRHFRRNVGRLLEVALVDGSTVAGRLVSAAPEELILSADGGARHVVAPSQIRRARVQVEFGHAEHTEET